MLACPKTASILHSKFKSIFILLRKNAVKMKPNLKNAIKALALLGLLTLIYVVFFTNDAYTDRSPMKQMFEKTFLPLKSLRKSDYNVWLIFTKVSDKSPLKYKFHNLVRNILNVTTVPVKFHIIIDKGSKQLALNEISDVVSETSRAIHYKLYDIEDCARAISDIVEVMTPHFSSKPGTYYSGALFYISLGLHRIAPQSQDTAVLLDCDLYFKADIAAVFKEFSKFKETALFGLAPELTPVYRHILHMYKAKHNTTFGEYYHSKNISNQIHPKGFQGYNSGVVLIKLSAIRDSKEYSKIVTNRTVTRMTDKFKFRGHLGDQDFYTLMGFEYPHLIQTLNCGFNRQLCTWWRDHGYREVFDQYFKCQHPTVILHGNCNTKIPKN